MESELITLLQDTGISEELQDQFLLADTKGKLAIAIEKIIEELSNDGSMEVGSDDESEEGEEESWSSKPEKRGSALVIGEHVEEDVIENEIVGFQDIVQDFDQYSTGELGRPIPAISLDNYPELLGRNKTKTIACDVARFGDDKTVILVLHGAHVTDIQTLEKSDIERTSDVLIRAVKEEMPDNLVIDSTGGLGASLVDILRRKGIDSLTNLHEIIYNATPKNDDLNVANVRAEMYVILNEKLRLGEITIPPAEELAEDLSRIKFMYRGDGEKLQIVPKSQIKKTFGRSCDFSDALAMSVYVSQESSLEIYV